MDEKELNFYFSRITGPIALCGCFICGTAVVSFYIFPKQRKFPNTVLVWSCIVDLIFCIFLTMRWIGGPLKHILTDNPNSIACRFNLYVELALEVGSAIVGVLVAFTLYSAIVVNVDFKSFTRQYYKWLMVALWLGPLVYPLISFIDKTPIQNGLCIVDSKLGVAMFIIPWAIMLILQIWFIIQIVIYICNINHIMRFHSTGTKGLLWLYILLLLDIRFFIILFNQTFLWLNFIIFDIFRFYHLPLIEFNVFLWALAPLFLCFNAMVVIISNTSLQRYVLRIIGCYNGIAASSQMNMKVDRRDKSLPAIESKPLDHNLDKSGETEELWHGGVSAFSACICGVAIIVSYLSPNLRKFPNVVLIWICISDFLYAFFIAVKMLPGPLNAPFNSAAVDVQSGIVNVLISYVLYASIVKRVTVEILNQKRRMFLLIIWLTSTIYPFVIFFEFLDKSPKDSYCTLSKLNSVVLRLTPWVLLFFVQLGFTVPVIKYIITIKSAVKSYSWNTDKNVNIWLYMRLSAIIIARLVFKAMVALHYMSILFHFSIPFILKDILIFIPILLSVNAFITLARNKAIKVRIRWIISKTCLKPKVNQDNCQC